jgi:hypothetical protein
MEIGAAFEAFHPRGRMQIVAFRARIRFDELAHDGARRHDFVFHSADIAAHRARSFHW